MKLRRLLLALCVFVVVSLGHAAPTIPVTANDPRPTIGGGGGGAPGNPTGGAAFKSKSESVRRS